MLLLTVRTRGPYYTNNGYLPCARARSGTQWLITVRLTSQPNVSDQLTLLPVRAQTPHVLDKDQFRKCTSNRPTTTDLTIMLLY